MTDNNHTEEMKKEVERLFKEASEIDGMAARIILNRTFKNEEERRDLLKDIISGEHQKRMDANDAAGDLRKILMKIRMLGDLLSVTNEGVGPAEETVWVAGETILDFVGEAEEARELLADRWGELDYPNDPWPEDEPRTAL